MRTCDGCAVESVRCPLPKWDWEGRHNAEQLCQPVGYFVVLVTALLLLWCCCCYLYRWLLSDARVVAKHVCNALCKLSAANLPPAIFTPFYLPFYHIHPYSTTCHCLSPVTFERIFRWQSWQALKAGELMTTGWYAPSKGKYANLEGGEGGPCGETGRLDHFGPAWTSLDFGKYACWFDISFCARNRLSRFQDRLRQRWCFLAPGYHGYRFASRSPIWTHWRSLLLCDQDKHCSFLVQLVFAAAFTGFHSMNQVVSRTAEHDGKKFICCRNPWGKGNCDLFDNLHGCPSAIVQWNKNTTEKIWVGPRMTPTNPEA